MENYFGDAEMIVEKEMEIQAPLKVVYEAYRDPVLWKQVLEDVIDVKVFYNDGSHQEFNMMVQRGANLETVRAVRFCFTNSSIEMFQTQPPPLFHSMKGIWRFTSVGNKTNVWAQRNFELKQNVSFNPDLLISLLERNLLSFKKWLEK